MVRDVPNIHIKLYELVAKYNTVVNYNSTTPDPTLAMAMTHLLAGMATHENEVTYCQA